MTTPKSATNAAKAARKKASTDKVVKRPKRGFHRFRNGLLNVTPKGNEIEVVEKNQNSPLLCLPPELRNRIWEYALGGNTIKMNVYQSTEIGAPNPFSLLQTCRQVYAETALLPFKLNTIAFGTIGIISRIKMLNSIQRKHVTALELRTDGYTMLDDLRPVRLLNVSFAKDLPALKWIIVKGIVDSTHIWFMRLQEEKLRARLQSGNRGVTVVFIQE